MKGLQMFPAAGSAKIRIDALDVIESTPPQAGTPNLLYGGGATC
jgi:hypothetical protein